MKSFLLLLFTASLFSVSAQEMNIVPYLKQIEKGNAELVRRDTELLRKENRDDPSVLFLDAALTEDGAGAAALYEKIWQEHPKSNFADAALYRVFSYYYSLGVYNKASGLLEKLKNDYPSSPYINSADRDIPDIVENADTEIDKSPEVLPVQKEEPAQKIYRFTVQAGAFLNRGNAENLLRALESNGYECSIVKKEVGGSSFNVVQAGRFENETDAAALLELLEKEYRITGRLTDL